MAIVDKITETQIWKSIFRHPMPTDRRNRVVVMLTNFFLHLHPVSVRKQGIALSYTWCMGGTTFFLFIVEVVTGVLLMFYYRPATAVAYSDMKDLETVVTFGLLLRNLHRYSAHGMVITVFLHMVRVFYTGAYKAPREFNWIVGVILLTLTFLLSFTGYLLPWDQLAIWAVTVGTNMAGATPVIGDSVKFAIVGGYEIGDNTLIRWYVLHVIALPLFAALFMTVHFWRIRKDGGIAGPL